MMIFAASFPICPAFLIAHLWLIVQNLNAQADHANQFARMVLMTERAVLQLLPSGATRYRRKRYRSPQAATTSREAKGGAAGVQGKGTKAAEAQWRRPAHCWLPAGRQQGGGRAGSGGAKGSVEQEHGRTTREGQRARETVQQREQGVPHALPQTGHTSWAATSVG